MADEYEEEGGTERRTCTLAATTIRRLERLARLGTHGTSLPRVMTQLIEAGVRDAIEKGYIPVNYD